MTLKKEYAIQAVGWSGEQRAWFDAYPNALMAGNAAKHYKNEHPEQSVYLMRRTTPAAQIGAQWEVVREVK